MCTVFAEAVQKNPEHSLIDVTSAASLPVSKERLLTEIHLYEADGTLRTGADAVLTALAASYSFLRPLRTLVRLPFLKPVANIVYNFVSKRRTHFFGGVKARLYWLFILTILGTGLGVILSWPLWGVERAYPTIPVSEVLLAITGLTPVLTLLLLATLTLGLLTYRRFSLLATIILVMLISLILLDLSRLQPWIFHYLLLFGLFSFWSLKDSANQSKILDAARVLIASIYFWSGFQKLNTAFFLEIFPWFTGPLWSPFGDTGAYAVIVIGVFIPFVEMAFAIGLLTKRFRMISIVASFCMLVLVIFTLTFVHDWNSVVWPWNVIIFLMVLVLFYKSDTNFPIIFKNLKKSFLALPLLIFCLLIPLGNIFGYSHHYLAWSLYSGRVPTAEIIASPTTLATLPGYTRKEDDKITTLPFAFFSLASVNVPPYPEVWYFTRAFEYLCTHFGDDEALRLAITERDFFLSHRKTETIYTCE